jgi:hypothetical protein
MNLMADTRQRQGSAIDCRARNSDDRRRDEVSLDEVERIVI